MLLLRPLGSLTAVSACLLGACGSSPTADFSGLHHPALVAVDSVALGNMPFAVAISPAGVVYVTQAAGGSIARADLPDQSFPVHIAVGALPSQVRMSPDGRTAYVSNQDAGTITVVDVATDRPIDTIALAPSILTIGLSSDGRRLYALTDYHGVYVIDAAARTRIDSIGATKTGAILTGVAFHPTLALMYICARDAGTITTIDTRTNVVLKTDTVTGARIQNVAVARDGSELYATDIQRSGLLISALEGGSTGAPLELLLGSGQVRNAFDVAVTPDNTQVYVSTLADGKVYVVNRVSRSSVAAIATGGSARYIAFDANGSRAVITNEMGWVNFIR
jgi:YVTN family beta-propeller protein